MNVVVAVSRPLGSGGLGWQVYLSVRALARAGMLARVVACGAPHPGISGDRQVALGHGRWLRLLHHTPLRWAKAWYGWLEEEVFDRRAAALLPDAEIFHGWAGQCGRTMKAARRQGMKTLLEGGTTHVHWLYRELKQEYARYGSRVVELNQAVIRRHLDTYDQADLIRPSSELARRSFLEFGVPESRLARAPTHLAVDTGRFTPGEKKDDVFRVVFAGSLGLRKGFPYLLEAFRRWKPEGAELVLVGGPTDRLSRKLLERYRKEIPFLVKPGDPLPWYRRASVVVLPSIEDAFGLVVLEAMACGVPVVVSDHAGACECVEEGREGFIFPARDTDALVERLRQLRDHEDRRREMGAAARVKALQFDQDRFAEKILALYRKLSPG